MPYKFDPDVLAELCGEIIEQPLESGELFTGLIEKLSNTYPDLLENKERRWIGTRAGGILGRISFLRVGLREYLLIFGSPCGTSGFTGRCNFMDLYKVILAGEYTTYDLENDQIAPTTYVPGDLSHLARGQARGLNIKPGSWHLEYGRGPNITAMPFGLADTLLSSVELKPLMLTTSEYVKLLANGLRK